MTRRITLAEARRMMARFHVNGEVVSAQTLRDGMQVELEHGRRASATNVTSGRLLDTAKIALAHLEEHPEYYVELAKMEARLAKRRRNHVNIYH